MEPSQDYSDDLERARALQEVKKPQYMHRAALAYLMSKYQDLDPIDVMSLAIKETMTAWETIPEDIQGEMIHFWQNNFEVSPTPVE